MLPILTFEDSRLSPSLGYAFDSRWLEPYESIVGMLWKFARTNALPGHLVVEQITVSPTDPYAGVAPMCEAVDVRAIARLLGARQKSVRVGLGGNDRRRKLNINLRYCRRCMGIGYHGIVHQYEGAALCPIHGEWLEEVCRACSLPSLYRLDARMLDAPFRCCHCRRPYASAVWSSARPKPLSKRARTAATRAALLG